MFVAIAAYEDDVDVVDDSDTDTTKGQHNKMVDDGKGQQQQQRQSRARRSPSPRRMTAGGGAFLSSEISLGNFRSEEDGTKKK